MLFSPRGSFGMQPGFWVQMARSSTIFHGSGLKRIPAAAPPQNLKMSRRVISRAMAHLYL
jgi:hypothetical protein